MLFRSTASSIIYVSPNRKPPMKKSWRCVKKLDAMNSLWSNIDGFLYTLIAFVVVDYITGILRAGVEKKLSSRIGFKGIAKKIMLFILVGVGHLIDAYLITGANGLLRNAIIFFYISNEGISIIENSSALGLPVPEKLKIMLEQLKEEKSHDK